MFQRLGSGKYKKTHFIVNDPAWTFALRPGAFAASGNEPNGDVTLVTPPAQQWDIVAIAGTSRVAFIRGCNCGDIGDNNNQSAQMKKMTTIIIDKPSSPQNLPLSPFSERFTQLALTVRR